MSNENRAAFLFGSGISRPSGAPMVGDITRAITEGAWKPHTDSRFFPCNPDDGGHSMGIAKRAQNFLLVVRDYIQPRLLAREGRAVNYEDLYAAALQIVQDETVEIPNPLIGRAVDEIRGITAFLHIGQESHIDRNAFASLADRALDLVQWGVYHSLTAAHEPKGLGAITDAARRVGEIDIFSLNHDLLLETQFQRAGIPYSDGFSNKRADLRVFDWTWGKEGRAVRLFKLHGSIDWFRCRFKEWDQFAALRGDVDHLRDDNGDWVDLLDVKPMFLTGTTVKEQTYGTGLFGDIFTEFRSRLSRYRTLIACGYGWGDKGINVRIRQWLRDRKENRIVILHDDPDEDLSRKRFWYWRWDDAIKAGKVIVLPMWLSVASVDDLSPYFED